jgi:general secretion pathway protein E
MQSKSQGRWLDLNGALKDLVNDGLLLQADASSLAVEHKTREEALLHPLQYIASKGHSQPIDKNPLNIRVLSQWLATKSHLEFVHIDPLKIDVAAVTAVMPLAYAKRYGILCIEVTPEELVVVTMEPFNLDWLASLEQTSRRTMRAQVATPEDIKKYTLEFYSLSKSVFGARASSSDAPSLTNFEQLLEMGTLKDADAQDKHVVNIVDWLLQYAFEQRASDIHLEPRRIKGRVRFRIDGVLQLVYELPDNVMPAMTSRLKILGRMDVAEKRRPQDGRIKTKAPNGKEVELRLSTMATAFGEKLVIRIFDPDVILRSFSQLGLLAADLLSWQAMTERANGIVLVTGPTGSGKTTTLYSTLKLLAKESVNVSTLEDPIEMVVDSFNQSQIQPAIGYDFAAGIRTLMRQDPDIIMVGEIRDNETAEMALQAALTGHLVLSTLHTNDAPSAISRLLELGVPGHLLKATLVGVMAQRLVRTLCMACRKAVTPSAAVWQELIAPFVIPKSKIIYQPAGCRECRNTGYAGRQGIYEIMSIAGDLLAALSSDADMQYIRQLAVNQGMRPLRLAGATKVTEGITSIEEVMRVTPEHIT